MPDVVTDLFRSLMFFFDSVIYGFIPKIYALIIYLAQIDIFSTDDNIAQLMNQIYVLLGIFMLFKVSFSFLRYIIDPESFSDGKKGVGKLVTNVVVVILLLVTVPYIFNAAYKLQYEIVSSNVLGELILGASGQDDSGGGDVASTLSNIFTLSDDNQATDIQTSETADDIKSRSTDLQFLIFGAFFSINTDVLTPEGDTDNKVCEGHPIIGSIEMALDQDCLETIEEYFKNDDDLGNNGADLADYFPDGTTGNDNRNFSELDNILNWKINTDYVINYLPGISTITGIYLIFLLITFCIDVALRAIKLCFLQMIAPISIVSYVDPKESSGDSKLAAWAKECWKTYLSLFIRLAVIFLVLRFVSIIASGVFSEQGFASQIGEHKIWVFVFLVLGAFVFAKQVPKLLEGLLGMKSTGELQLNPFKGIGGTLFAAGGAAVGSGVANALGFGINAFSRGKKIKDEIGKTEISDDMSFKERLKARTATARRAFAGKSVEEWNSMNDWQRLSAIGKATGAGLSGFAGIAAGAASGAGRAVMGTKGNAGGFGDVKKQVTDAHDKTVTARENRESRSQQSLKTRLQNAATSYAGVKNEFGGVGVADKTIRNLQEQLQQNAQIQSQLREQFAEMITNKGIKYSSVNNINQGVFNYGAYKSAVESSGGKAVSKDDYNKMSFYDRYTAVQPDSPDKLVLTSQSERRDFNELMAIQSNVQATIDNEKRIKKEISDNQRAAGIDKNDKPPLGG